MYKVFINERPIILTDSLFVESDFDLLNYKNTFISEIIHKLTEGSTKGIILLCADLQEAWRDFKSHFKVISASGGLVINKQLEFLFIFRGGKWDLPKGRIEKGEQIKEAALREVKEECGISKLNLGDFLITTYHIFFQNNQNRLKETHWFQMGTTTKEVLIPQLEEGITIAIFKNKEDSVRALDNSYGNIHLVFKAYYQK
ncbi:MAG: NUDIX hydrolase [Gammaproteobacteria bacterium]|nr:NUDIX hydrolase [Gammaproteobacteria bacterium]MDG1508825.1 NUDIX domain-containing protein [Flavobacteriaceae bacterium]MDG2275986.1 NUDIX domain-containing protein [Flavobacteriaceae bacterium]|tara:strand:+ start:106 stop:705 length:600 start_codon:yes stop_codon:yes gene_type:complete